MICSVCQMVNVGGYRRCSRCGAHVNRSVPPLLVIQNAVMREVLWGISLGELAVPLIFLGAGSIAAWQIWEGVGFSSYWSLAGFAVLLPGTILTLSVLSAFRRVRSPLLELGFFAFVSLMVAGIVGIFVAIYFFYSSLE